MSFKSKFKSWIVAIGLLGSMTFLKANAQTKPTVEQSSDKSSIKCISPVIGKIALNRGTRTISGVVVDENNQPFPGVIISVNQNISTQSDAAGKFRVTVPQSDQQLKVSSIGYVTQIVTVDNSNTGYQIKLLIVPQVLGEVVIMKRTSFIKRTYYKYIKRPIYKLFK
jgi:hypothetical protein